MRRKIVYLSFVLVLELLIISFSVSGATTSSVVFSSSGSIAPIPTPSPTPPQEPDYTVSSMSQLLTVMAQVVPGDLVYLRAGVYQSSSQITFSRSGTSGNPITFAGYPGEEVILDGSPYTPSANSFSGFVMITGDWVTLSNMQIRNAKAGQSAGNHGVLVRGDDVTLDNLELYNNAGMGALMMGARARLLYVISHDNIDNGPNQGNGGNADGLGTQFSGTGTYYYRCITYHNSDDGIDNLEGDSNVVEYCVSYDNGLLNGDGAGFKAGVGDVYRYDVAYNNNLEGFTSPLSGPPYNGDDVFNHCISYHNGVSTSGQYGKPASNRAEYTSLSGDSTFTNNIAVATSADYYFSGGDTNSFNTWNLGISNYGFISTDPNNSNFLSLSSNSQCRGKASDGTDLGALQYGQAISDLLGSS